MHVYSTVQPQQDKRHRKLRNANSFNSYVHEQMAITMAMMEANFEGVGLSHRQQERVEELRAGLDSFSLTNIAATMAEQQHEPHPQTIHDHWDNNKPSSNNRNENRKRIHGNAGIEMTHGGMRTKLLYKSRSYDTSYHEDTSHKSDWLGDKRHGSYLQQEGSYLQQAKVAQSIKVGKEFTTLCVELMSAKHQLQLAMMQKAGSAKIPTCCIYVVFLGFLKFYVVVESVESCSILNQILATEKLLNCLEVAINNQLNYGSYMSVCCNLFLFLSHFDLQS